MFIFDMVVFTMHNKVYENLGLQINLTSDALFWEGGRNQWLCLSFCS